MSDLQHIGALELLLLAIPVCVVIAISVGMGLQNVRQIGIATARSIIQLVGIGLVLAWVFDRREPWIIVGLLAIMTAIAGYSARSQIGASMKWLGSVLTVVLGAATAITLIYLSYVVLRIDAADPRYLIPLGGMLLGNAMTSATLAVERLGSEIWSSSDDVEVLLALGASPLQAVLQHVRNAVRAALIPIVNAMMIVGVVKLPGMMTGQMLGGSEPFQAAMYQFLILVGILCTDALAAVAITLLLCRRFFTEAWQLNMPLIARFQSS